MTPKQRLKSWKTHDSQRGWFAKHFYEQMSKDKDIFLLVGDLGYKMFDAHFEDFPDRCINCGASEQAMMGIAVGLALEGRKPFVYSITPFVLYRPFEWLRNYLDHESVPVRIVGAGRDRDYGTDGFTHWCQEAEQVLNLFPNIRKYFPVDKKSIPSLVEMMVKDNSPAFISLTRG